ncbi:hypothetical protein PC119_g19389 [Phytophthora cactorum]|nr:hypothetical protein PC119_g19389 [Phytophthora cactorum]
MGGRMAHATFKIPLKLNDTSTCSIFKQSHLKGLIQIASLVIWDEAPMTHRHAFEAVDRSLRDLMDNDDEPFGGKVFVLSGDFRQILPVVVRGTPAQTIDACLKSSTLWPKFQQLHLRENMRVMSAQNESTATELAEVSEFRRTVESGVSVQVQGADRVPTARGGGRSVHRQHSVHADFRVGIKERCTA